MKIKDFITLPVDHPTQHNKTVITIVDKEGTAVCEVCNPDGLTPEDQARADIIVCALNGMNSEREL